MEKKKDRIGFKYAIQGFFTAFLKERNMKVHIIFMFVVIFTGLLLELSVFEWLFILLAIALVLTSELFNTAIELIVDELYPAYHERAKNIKDISAGAVLISAIFAAIVGIVIFLPKIINFIN